MSRRKQSGLAQRLQREGRGQGEGPSYRPWIRGTDFPSTGVVTSVWSELVGRVVEVLSGNELSFFHILEASEGVVDINEQFPLPLDETVAIAKQIGVKHPTVAGELWVLTTDFRVKIERPSGVGYSAFAVKPWKHLEGLRVLERLEIERRYWAQREVPWRIVTERNLNETLVRNLEWVRAYRSVSAVPFDDGRRGAVAGLLRERIDAQPRVPLADVCLSVDQRLGFTPGTCLALSRHQLASGEWPVDFSLPFSDAAKHALRILPSNPRPRSLLRGGLALSSRPEC